jgi:hypothetical protein
MNAEQYSSPRSNKLTVPNLGIVQPQTSAATPYDKQSNQFGLFLNETDPFLDLHSPANVKPRQAFGVFGGNMPQQNMFNEINVL